MKRILWSLAVVGTLATACSDDSGVSIATDAGGTTLSVSSAAATTTTVESTTTIESTTTTVAETTPPTTVKPECVNGASENRNVTDTSYDYWSCVGGKWTFKTTVAIAQPLTVEEVDGALSPAIAAYVDQFSEESYAPVAAAAQSLIDAKRPFPVVDPLSAALAQAQIKLLAEYPGHATLTTDYRDVFRAIGLLRPIAPSLPVVLLDGNYTVGEDMAPGRYRTVGEVDGCYWETLDEAGEINDNNFVDAAPQVIMTVRDSDFAVNSEDCGPWILI